MSPSVNPKPPFTSCSLASRDTRASSAGSNLTTASLSAWDCALAPQAPRVATNRITAEIDEFFMTPRSHPQNSSDLRNVLARLQAVRDDRFEPILDGVAQTVQAFPHPMRSAYGRIEDVLEGLHLVPQQLNVAGPALDFREIAFQGVDELRHFFQIDFRGRFLSCVVPGHLAAPLIWAECAGLSLHEQHRDGRDVHYPVCARTEQQVGRRAHPAGAHHDEIAPGEPRLPDDGLGHGPHEDAGKIPDPRRVEELPRLRQSRPSLPVVVAPDLARADYGAHSAEPGHWQMHIDQLDRRLLAIPAGVLYQAFDGLERVLGAVHREQNLHR